MDFYTNFHQYKGHILIRGYEGKKRVEQKIKLQPSLFIESDKPSKYQNVFGQNVEKIDFNSTFDCRSYIKENDYKKIYGMTTYQYPHINQQFPGQMDFRYEYISIVNIDIETRADSGFPDIQKADKEITAITLMKGNKIIALGCRDFTTDNPNILYIKCENEKQLLLKFIEIWTSKEFSPDIVTGWNIEFFDIPYIVNRISKILGREYAEKLSPWGILEEKSIFFNGRDQQSYAPVGIAILDYMQAYKKFSFKNQESYKLDYIARIELGKEKLDYSEYDSLDDFYLKDFQKFMEYNIYDTVLISLLEEKLGFIAQIVSIAYDAKVNYIDAFTSVRLWDVIIHNYLMEKNIVVDPGTNKKSTHVIAGGYVKHPDPGLYKWVVSFDLNSLYPHLIMQYNISPETFFNSIGEFLDIDDIVQSGLPNHRHEGITLKEFLIGNNLTICPTGCMFSKNIRGFLPELMQKLYDDRKTYQAKMKEAKKKLEVETDPILKFALEKEVARNHNMQLAKKIQLNSAYGALANVWFRWFDERYAESITLSGQLSIKWIEKYINEYLVKIAGQDDYIVAMDTDSVYLKLDKIVDLIFKGKDATTDQITTALDKFCEEKLQTLINDAFKKLSEMMNAYEQKMVMKRENISNKAIWTAKKRYILNVCDSEGFRYSSPKIKMVGIEAIKSSTPEVCRKALKEAIDILLNKDQDSLIEYVDQFRSKHKSLQFHEIASPRSVNGITEYSSSVTLYRKGTPIHVRGSLVYNQLLKKHAIDDKMQKIFDGDKIKYSYMTIPNPTNENVLACPGELPAEFGMDKYIDYETQFSKTFEEPLKSITDPIGWELEKRQTLW